MMQETYVDVTGGTLYVRHTEKTNHPKTLLFLHGLGESGLSFLEAFDEHELSNKVNVVIPDLLGYGRSSAAAGNDYSFDAHLERIWQLVSDFKLREIYLIGHSMGGDLATLMCEQDQEKRIKGLVNVEGNLTPEDAFISRQAAWAAKRPGFDEWFRGDFMHKTVLEASQRTSWRRYYASLWFCRSEAFKANATELYKMSLPIEGKLACIAGERYLKLKVKKIFCWGEDSLKPVTQDLLVKKKIENQSFRGAGHWLMIDCQEEFYQFLAAFCLTG